MSFVIKGFLIIDGTLDCRFELLAPSFQDVIELLNKVCLYEAYDYVKVFPYEVTEVK